MFRGFRGVLLHRDLSLFQRHLVTPSIVMYMYIVMKRTQLYLDEAVAKKLAALSRQKGTTVSELVRESIREKYGVEGELDRAELARKLAGVWAPRKDRASVDAVVRRLRRGKGMKARDDG